MAPRNISLTGFPWWVGLKGFFFYVFKQRKYKVDIERNILENWETSNGGVILLYATL